MLKSVEKKIKNSKIDVLVSQLSKDVAARGLRPGDRYFMAHEIGTMYGVSTVTAHRALTQLAEDGILMRTRKSGTFVGEKAMTLAGQTSNFLRVVHIFMPLSYCYLNEIKDMTFIESIQAASPSTAVQVHYVPEDDPYSYMKRTLPQIKTNSDSEGMILIRSSEEVQRHIASESVNAVVFGSVYPGVKNLASLDVDQSQTGALMAREAVGKKFGNYVLLMSNQWRSGDNILLSSILETFGKAGVNMGAFSQRSLPTIKDIVEAEVHRILTDAEDSVMFMCRSDYFADIVVETANSMGLFYGEDFGVISGGHFRSSSTRKYPCVMPKLSVRQQITKLVEMLKDGMNKKERNNHSIIEVELCKS
jgi:DNA-binding LacI/PurR family transcriptional regulator